MLAVNVTETEIQMWRLFAETTIPVSQADLLQLYCGLSLQKI